MVRFVFFGLCSLDLRKGVDMKGQGFILASAASSQANKRMRNLLNIIRDEGVAKPRNPSSIAALIVHEISWLVVGIQFQSLFIVRLIQCGASDKTCHAAMSTK